MNTDERYGYIYITTNKETGDRYVGKHRGAQRDPDYYGSGRHIRKQIKEYGTRAFTNRIVEWCDSDFSLHQIEYKWIDKLDAERADEWLNIDIKRKKQPSQYNEHEEADRIQRETIKRKSIGWLWADEYYNTLNDTDQKQLAAWAQTPIYTGDTVEEELYGPFISLCVIQ
jgi:hypothetical protein